MKKLSLLTVASIAGVLCVPGAYQTNPAFAKEPVVSREEAESIKEVMEEIAAAVQSGDQQLVSKLLASAIKSHPKVADKIISAFIDSQATTPESAAPSPKALNVSQIINSVVSSLQNEKGSEGLVASVLSSYTPAAGGNSKNGNKNNPPPPLSKAGKLGGDRDDVKPPRKNQNQVSAH